MELALRLTALRARGAASFAGTGWTRIGVSFAKQFRTIGRTCRVAAMVVAPLAVAVLGAAALRMTLTTAVAAYNSGLWAYYDLSKTGDPDRHTTGRDYSADTIRRAQVFRKFLG